MLRRLRKPKKRPVLEIEFDKPTVANCNCCGGRTTRLTRFVHRNGEACAVYHAVFADNHPDKSVSLIASLGPWWDGTSPAERVAFAADLWATPKQSNVTISDAPQSQWAHMPMLGRQLTREEALRHPLLKEFYQLTDHIVRDDAPVREYLAANTVDR